MDDDDQYKLAPDPDESDAGSDDEVPVEAARAATKAGAPLPRMWKADPEPDEDKPKVKASKPKAAGPASRPKKKPGKVELAETPILETYEGRTRVRLAISAVGISAVFVVGMMIYNSVSGPAAVPEPTDEIVAEAPVVPKVAKGEDEAKLLLTQAKQVAKSGKADQVVLLLQKIMKTFPVTIAAKEATAALEREKQGLPLFPEGEAIVATPVESVAPWPTGPTTVVDAAAPAGARAGNADVVLPINDAEPSKSNVAGAGSSAFPANAKPLPAGFRPRPGTLFHTSGWPILIVGDRDGATMIFIAGATFPMGRDDGPLSESPSHSVTLSGYYIDQHEVTNRQYTLFLKETGKRAELIGSDDHPVVKVDAKDANAYAEWAGKKLPTEAQWELAARSPDGRIYPAGSEPPSWARPRTSRQVDPVMSFENDQSPYGVFDLAGNVWEWTNDWFDAKHFQTLKGQTTVNPIGPASSRAKPPLLTVKGGSKTWNTTWREGIAATTKLSYVGFRCALPVEGSTNQAPVANPGSTTAPINSNGVVPF